MLNQHITIIVDGTEQPMMISSDRELLNMTRRKKKEKPQSTGNYMTPSLQ